MGFQNARTVFKNVRACNQNAASFPKSTAQINETQKPKRKNAKKQNVANKARKDRGRSGKGRREGEEKGENVGGEGGQR